MRYKKQNKNSDAFFQNIEWYSLFSLSRFLLRRLSFVFHSLVILVCILDQKETINRLDHWHISKMMSDYVFICSLFILSLLPSIHSDSSLPPGMLILLFYKLLIHFFNMSCYIYNYYNLGHTYCIVQHEYYCAWINLNPIEIEENVSKLMRRFRDKVNHEIYVYQSRRKDCINSNGFFVFLYRKNVGRFNLNSCKLYVS